MNPAVETLINLPPANIDGPETSGTTYYGEAPQGISVDEAGWRIWKKVVTSNVKEITLPQDEIGNPSFDFKFKWSDRATLIYSR